MKTRILHTELALEDAIKDTTTLIVAYELCAGPRINHLPIFRYPDSEMLFRCKITQEELNQARQNLEALGISYESGYYVIDSEYAIFNFASKTNDLAIIREIKRLPENMQQRLLTLPRIQEKIGREESVNKRTGEITPGRDIAAIIQGNHPQEREVEPMARPRGRSDEPRAVHSESLNPSTPVEEPAEVVLSKDQITSLADQARAAIRVKPNPKVNGKAAVDEEVPF